MKVELLIIILSLLYISTYQNENITLNITELTDESFSNYTKQYEFTLLFFHSKNCIPCRKAMSSLRRANYYLQSLNPPRAIALIDIESNSTKDIQSRFPNQPLPYLYLYSSKMDKVLPYSGLLTSRSIITYVLKNTGKNVNSLTSLEHIQSFINENITYMSVFNFKEGINEQFEELSRYYPYSLFANCFSEECKKYFNPKGDILILKQFEKEQSRQRIDLPFTNVTYIQSIISKNSIPLVGPMTDFATEIIFRFSLNSIGYIKVDNETKSMNATIDEIKEYLIKDNSNISHCFIYDIHNNPTDASILRYMGFEIDSFKQDKLFILSFEEEDNFKIYKKKNKQTIPDFIKGYLKGELKAEIKSEAEPKRQPKENFKIIVGKTFNKEIAQNTNQDVVLGFVTINCPECETVQDILLNLSEQYKDNHSILFALTDPNSNDIPNVDIKDLLSKGKPLIRFYYRKKDDGYIDFKGEYNQEEIEKWISEHHHNYVESTTDL